ncbi:Transposase DDE domain-containing protein [Thiothrix eikelboomii]|uniref:Transposase DDE domain-containing protein n=1 Tax=Thiothrix eikelboomii TaxID=92487 RepID=A0A1T4WE25_9GAMM|nr:transposase [Thiothrix eikelboomii]SKA75389.1 Transposase DDE domain-containing protein [Thiothrix eikelboomii]
MVDSGKLRFIVIDGSTVQEPGATATTYRLHIAIDLINLSLHQVEVTTDKEGENLDHYTLAAGDVVLIDLGYNQPKTLVPFIDRGGDVVLRYNAHSMNLYEDGEGDDAGHLVKIDWYTRLRKLGKRPSGVPVWLCHGNKRIQGYLHAIPLPGNGVEPCLIKEIGA